MRRISRAGVSQVLNRLSYSSTLSHLRRHQLSDRPRGQAGQASSAAQLIVGYDLSRGDARRPSVGLVKNLALMALVSVGLASEPIWSSWRSGRWKTWKKSRRRSSLSRRRFSSTACGLACTGPGGLGADAAPASAQARHRFLSERRSRHSRSKELRLYTDYGSCTRRSSSSRTIKTSRSRSNTSNC